MLAAPYSRSVPHSKITRRCAHRGSGIAG